MKDFKPMLAHVYTDETQIDWSQPVYIQPKLDGVRCIFTKDGAFSRTGKRFMNVKHIERALQFVWEKFPELILDGELYNHELKDDFEKIISLVRKQTPTETEQVEARDLIQFNIYDVWMEVSDYRKRFKFLVRTLAGGLTRTKFPQWRIHDTHNCATPAMVKVMHERFLKKGYEGSIIRLNGKYEQKRSKNLLKVKDFSDSEAKIINWVEGKGKRRGTIGKFIAIDSNGIEFGMPVMDKFKYLQENFNEMKTWIGKTATFTYFERTKRGSYRHPLFKCLRNYE